MNPSDYQKLCARTECNQERSRQRLMATNLVPVRLNHGVLGLTGEVGELASSVERWLYYGKELDRVNIGEEVGDCLWYLCLICNATGMSMSTIMEANIAKLKARFPEKYSDDRAAAENRNREAERKTLEEVYPPSLPSYDPQQEHEARQRADEEAALDLLAQKADSADDRASIEIIARAARVGITTQEIYDLPDWQSVVAAIRERQELEGNVGRELEKQVMEDVSSRPVGKEITEALNRHEDPTGQSDALLRIGEVGKSVVAGHTRETAAMEVPTVQDPNMESLKTVDRTKVQDWLCACWDGTSGAHINPPYNVNCGRCGRRRTSSSMTYPTPAEIEQEMQARGSPLSRMPHTWQCLACQQLNSAGNTHCVYCGKTTLKEAPSTGPHSSHDWYSFSSNPIYHRCRKCGAYQHLLSGFLPCHPTAPEPVVHETVQTVTSEDASSTAHGSTPTTLPRCDDCARGEHQDLEQDGHGWAEPPVSEEEGGRN